MSRLLFNTILLIANLMLLNISVPVLAEEPVMAVPKIKKSREEVSYPFQKKSDTSLLLQHTSFISSKNSYFRPGGAEAQIGLVGIGFEKRDRLKGFDYGIETELYYSPLEEVPYINLPEALIGRKFSTTEISFGRVLNDWSVSDSLWEQGLWQSRFQWDKLNTEQQGLFGLFIKSDLNKSWSSTFLLSPLFIPELGPAFKVEEGKFIAKNPWFLPPVNQVTIPGVVYNSEIYFDVQHPNVEKVVFQNSVAAQLKWSQGGRFCQIAYAYKPMNQALLKFDTFVRTYLPNSPPGVTAQAEFVYHQIANLECGEKYITPLLSGWVSFTGEEPDANQPLAERWTAQNTQSTKILSGNLRYDLSRLGVGGDLSLSAMQLWGGNASDRGYLAVEGASKFEGRYRLSQAIKLSYRNSDLQFFKKQAEALVATTYDFQQNGVLLKVNLALNLRKNLSLFAVSDILGILDLRSVQEENGFLRLYRANDQVQLGMKYVF